MGVEACGGEFPFAIGAGEKPAVVADLLLHDRDGAVDGKRNDLHRRSQFSVEREAARQE